MALDKGYVVRIVRGYVFKTAPVLADYSTKITSIKDKATLSKDLASRNVAKLLLNSLYGKFASNYHDVHTAIVDRSGFDKLAILHEISNITELEDGLTMVSYKTRVKEGVSPDTQGYSQSLKNFQVTNIRTQTNVAMASAITRLGRVMLYGLIDEVVINKGVLCYVDTDSIFAWFPENPEEKKFGPFI